VSVGSVLNVGGPTEPIAPAAPVERVVELPSDRQLDSIDLAATDDGSSDPDGSPSARASSTTTTTTTTVVVSTRLPIETERSTPTTTVTSAPSTTTTAVPPTTTAAPTPTTTAPTPTTTAPTPTTTAPTPTTTAPPTTTTAPSAGPVAVDDHVTAGGSTLHVAVLANDLENGFPLDPSTLKIVVAPHHAENFGVSSDGVRYHALDGFDGPDQLTYQICDTGGGCSTAILHILVSH
jgi:hypothetical protein